MLFTIWITYIMWFMDSLSLAFSLSLFLPLSLSRFLSLLLSLFFLFELSRPFFLKHKNIFVSFQPCCNIHTIDLTHCTLLGLKYNNKRLLPVLWFLFLFFSCVCARAFFSRPFSFSLFPLTWAFIACIYFRLAHRTLDNISNKYVLYKRN